jgi:hypothetical protein
MKVQIDIANSQGELVKIFDEFLNGDEKIDVLKQIVEAAYHLEKLIKAYGDENE